MSTVVPGIVDVMRRDIEPHPEPISSTCTEQENTVSPNDRDTRSGLRAHPVSGTDISFPNDVAQLAHLRLLKLALAFYRKVMVVALVSEEIEGICLYPLEQVADIRPSQSGRRRRTRVR